MTVIPFRRIITVLLTTVSIFAPLPAVVSQPDNRIYSAFSQSDVVVVTGVAWNNDARYMAVAFQSGGLQIVDVLSNSVLYSNNSLWISDLTWNPVDSDQLAVAIRAIGFGNGNSVIQLMNAKTGEINITLEAVPYPREITWRPDGTQLAGASNPLFPDPTYQSQVVIWDAASGKAVSSARLPRDTPYGTTISALQWSPNSNWIAGAVGTSIVIWDAVTFEVSFTLKGHTGSISSLAWSSDSQLLASSSSAWDETVRIWDVDLRTNVNTFSSYFASEISWSPLGNQLAVTDGDGIRVLDVLTGEELESYHMATYQQAVAYSPYGGRLAFGGVAPDDVTNQIQTDQMLADGAVSIVVPVPTYEQLGEIAQRCLPHEQAQSPLSSPTTQDQLPDFIAQLDLLADAQPVSGCTAELRAVATALLESSP